MQLIRRSVLVVLLNLVAAGCTHFSAGASAPPLPADARWGVAPLLNYSQAPQAGERSAQILLSVLGERGLRPASFARPIAADALLADDAELPAQALAWARQQGLDYLLGGSVEEWQYKSGLDAEPAVGLSLRLIDVASGELLWSASAARVGRSRESLAGTTQQLLRRLVAELALP